MKIPVDTVPVGRVCYISVGLVIHADERQAHGTFVAEDLVVSVKDQQHPKPYIEGKDIVRWGFDRIRYLEYGTSRAPALFRRKTFEALYDVAEKLVSMDLAGAQTRVAYDTQQLYHNHSAWSFVLWHNLEGVRNRSIQKSAKYRNEIKPFQPKPAFYREDLEAISQNFQLKYVLAIMNSSFAQQWLAHKRRSKLRIYPEDWKPLPIAAIPRAEQQPLVDLVDSILGEFATYGHPLPAEAVGRVAAWEREIDAAVYTIYGIAPEQVAAIAAAAPTDVGESDEDGEG